jgi:hypothetical protein
MDESTAMDEDDGALTDDDLSSEVNNSRTEASVRSGTVPDPCSINRTGTDLGTCTITIGSIAAKKPNSIFPDTSLNNSRIG